MKPGIVTLAPKKLIGKRMTMSLAGNKTAELWRSFMMQWQEIKNGIGTARYSIQILPENYFSNFNPSTAFEKWAAIEVENFDSVPEGMETFTLPGGLYAVFNHKGGPAKGAEAFRYIFGEWLPNSGYQSDNRPQFEVLGEKYKGDDPDSEEEIWIPIK
jgi:AraC family transcriptional regulator